MEESKWISVKEKLPKHNIGVLVFIPEEDYHVTSGMWDISNKWVLLDEYREPESEVTHWMELPEIPEPYLQERKELYDVGSQLKEWLEANQKHIDANERARKYSIRYPYGK